MLYIWCVVFIAVALITVLKKVIVVVVELFILYILLSINLCFGSLGFIDNDIKDDIIVLRVFVIVIIRL